ncbi:MAG: serine hydrolase [Planctomycetes bacterium]|nr:serine hydrolase [Planctomycetota bacterium]
MNRIFVTLSAASIAALACVPTALRADTPEAGAEYWDGFVVLHGERVQIHLKFEAGFNDTILGEISLGETEHQPLENVAIVGNTLYFNIKDLPGNPTFKGTISNDGVSISGTYSENGAHHNFEVKWSEKPAPEAPYAAPATAVQPAPTPVASAAVMPAVTPVGTPDRWTGTINAPGAPIGVELTFQNNSDGTVTGQMSIPGQNVSGLALERFTISGSDLSFAVPGIPGSPRFVGRIGEDGSTVTGQYTQGEKQAPFVLTFVDPNGGTQSSTSVAAAPAAESTPQGSDAASSVVIADRWEGKIEIPNQPVSIQLDFFSHSDETISGDITVADQGTFDLPLTGVTIDGSTVNFGIQDVPGDPHFSGTITTDGTGVVGTFVHFGASFPFSLHFVNPSQPAVAATAPVSVSIATPAPVTNATGTTIQPAAVVSAPAPHSSAAPSVPTGPDHWNGAIELPGAKLNVKLEFTNNLDGTISGTVDIPDQNAKGLALKDIVINGSDLSFKIDGVPGDPTFKGVIKGETVSGDFTQGGQKFPFKLAFVEDVTKASTDALGDFASWADEARAAWEVPGFAMAIVKDGSVVLTTSAGVRDLDSKTPVTENTLFAIGSSTKAFTTFVLGTMVDDGKLEWDKPVRDLIPGFKLADPVATERLTVRDMVTHRSGLPRHDLMWYNSTLTRPQMVSRLAFLEPSKELRESWQYNNLMFLTAGYLSEQISGKSWEDNVRERIFKPLGMNGADFSVTDMQAAPDFAYPYEKRDGAMRKMPFRDISQMGPAGSINASVADMAKWVRVHLENGKFNGQQIISPTTLAEIHRPQMIMPSESTDPEVIRIGYAMGWFVSAYRGKLMVEHGGNIDGFSAQVTLLPNEHIGIVALTNMNGSPLPILATYHALDRLLGGERKDWSGAALAKKSIADKMEKEGKANKAATRKQGTSPSHQAADYLGEYEHPAYGVLTIESGGGGAGMTMSYNRISAPMEHWHYDTYVCGKNPADPTFEDQQLQFRTNTAGEIDAVEMLMDPTVKPIVFTKKGDSRLSDPVYLGRFVGDYQLGPQTISFSLKGNTLVAKVPGQPPYDLIPQRDDSFNLKGLTGFSVKFTVEGNAATQVMFVQPNGVFAAKRK